MIDLIEKLRVTAKQAPKADALIIEAAIDHIRELEAKLAEYEEDITDWQFTVEQQMGHRKSGK